VGISGIPLFKVGSWGTMVYDGNEYQIQAYESGLFE